jgi:hypothetical protein
MNDYSFALFLLAVALIIVLSTIYERRKQREEG